MAEKSVFLFFVAVLLVIPISVLIIRPVAAQSYTDVTVSEARVMIHAKPLLVLLDVRNQSEYENGHIRNSRLIPIWELSMRLDELNKTDEILVYCGVGGRSANASGILASNGFLYVYNMLGGITEWIREGNLVYIKYPSIQEAINNATAGDTICVSAGLYLEQLVLNKSVALEGENPYTTIVNGSVTMLTVTAYNASVADITVRYVGCACFGYSALNVTNSEKVNVTGTVIESDDIGIRVDDSREVIIAGNSITRAGRSCIVVFNSSEISVLDNDITGADGIEVDTSAGSIFSGNTIFGTNGAGIFAYRSNENIFSHNKISANTSTAISLSHSINNTFFGNTVSTEGSFGLFLSNSNYNSLFHNNFLFKGQYSDNSTNLWDDGLEGNFWLDFRGTDNDPNGLCDAANVLDSMNRDNYPLMGMFQSFSTSLNQEVDIVSDSTINEFAYLEPNRTLRFQVSNTTTNQTIGFCRMSIPHELIDPYNESISVVVDGGLAQVLFLNNALYDDGICRWIYFTFAHSTHEILIVPEFETGVLLLFFVITTVLAHGILRVLKRSFTCSGCQSARATV